jgi:hypothetical protein
MQACPSALQLSLHMDLTNFLKTARSGQHGDSALQGAIEVICLLGRFASASDLRLIREKSVFVLLFSSFQDGNMAQLVRCVFLASLGLQCIKDQCYIAMRCK